MILGLFDMDGDRPRIRVSSVACGFEFLHMGSMAGEDYIEPPKSEGVGDNRGCREPDYRHSEKQRQLHDAWRV